MQRGKSAAGARLAAVSLLVVALAACSRSGPVTYQGYVEGEYVHVASAFAGNLERLDVQRGTQIERGAPLYALEDENEQAQREEAEERRRNAEAQLADLLKPRRPSEVEAVRAQLAQAQAALELSRAELARTEALVARRFVSRQRLDEARSAYDRDRARVAQLQSEVATSRLAARPDAIAAARASVKAARAAVEQAEWRLQQKSVAAPVTGLVTETLYVRGEWVAAGAPVVVLLPPANIKVRFFVPETLVGQLKTGAPVSLACDGCAGPVAARITYIAPQAEFTPPVIYSKESRAKLVFLIEARPTPEDAVKLHPGQPVDVRLAGDEQPR